MNKLSDVDFVISRSYAVPRELLFSALTDPQRLQHCWGPAGFIVVNAKVDFRAGGSYHFGLRGPDDSIMWGKFVYREIVPPQRLVWVHSFADAAGNAIKHPMSLDWPLLMLATVTFDAHAQGTKLTIRFSALDATEGERNTFTANHESMRQGWGGTLDQLAAYLGNSQ